MVWRPPVIFPVGFARLSVGLLCGPADFFSSKLLRVIFEYRMLWGVGLLDV